MVKKRKVLAQPPSQNNINPRVALDKRFTGRTKQLNFKVREEFYWKLKKMSVEEKCLMVEILEKSFEEYEKKKKDR